ncbi:MAG TPA: hypothetical protein VLY04_04485 [Bryobacteraceae bacterium]|nr:hypothetical protein [Bryobacteraceae bacterium]
MQLAVLALLTIGSVAQAQDADPWKNMEFLLGKWTGVAGEKDTQIGAGQGSFSFERELSGKIVVRRNNAAYESGARHEDLMVIYLDAPNDTPRGIYFDSEGHVIRYNLTFPSADRAVFESDGTQAGPRYRLTYWMEGGSLNGKFEIGGQAGEYKTYMSWKSKKE